MVEQHLLRLSVKEEAARVVGPAVHRGHSTPRARSAIDHRAGHGQFSSQETLRLYSRAYYEVDQTTQTVLVLSAGRKVRNQVVIRAVEYDLREDEEGGTSSEEESR
jgi:hypothetical protein